ncbi:hypothetical protein B9T31_09625 [Acinetobacter sp. ANC 4558]|nr:hypothetical protein B9T31_09625 [Acinetobacter sp. ANC 4558]
MGELRQKFEALGNIKHVVSACTFDESDNEYRSERLPEYSQGFINGAWYVFQEQQSKIDQHYYGQSEEDELKQYAVLSQEKIEGGAMLVKPPLGKPFNFDLLDSYKEKIEQLEKEKAHLAEMNKRYLGKMQEQQDQIVSVKDVIKKHDRYITQLTINALEKALRGES